MKPTSKHIAAIPALCLILQSRLPAFCQIVNKAADKVFTQGQTVQPSSSGVSGSVTQSDTIPEKSSKPPSASDVDNMIDGVTTIPALVSKVGNKIQVSITNKKRKTRGLTGLEVTVKNTSDRAVLIDENEVILHTNGRCLKCASSNTIEATITAFDAGRHQYFKNAEESITSLATIGAVQTIEDQLRSGYPVPRRYGADELRREQEQTRLEKRVILPGETSSGYIFFAGKIDSNGNTLECRLHDLNNENDSASVSIAFQLP